MSAELPSNIPELPLAPFTTTSMSGSRTFVVFGDESVGAANHPVPIPIIPNSSMENKENIPLRRPSATSSTWSAKKKKGSLLRKEGVLKPAPLANPMVKVRKLKIPNHSALVVEVHEGLITRELLVCNQKAKELTELPLAEISGAYGVEQ